MQSFRMLITQVTLAAFLCTGLSAPSIAAVMKTQDYLAASARVEQLDTVQATLLREDVRQMMIARGVNPADVMARIAALPDSDLAMLAQQMDDQPAGGDLLALVGAVFIVLLILELTGVINIFNKV